MNFLTPTLGGMPDIPTLPASYTMSKTFFFSSLISHVLFLILFVFGFGFSIYRTIKKLKNLKFTDEEQEEPEEEKNGKGEGEEGNEQKKDTNDNLIYKFDEDEGENEKKDEDEDDEKDKNLPESTEHKEEQDEETRLLSERMFLLEDKILHFTPYVIGVIISINFLRADFMSAGCLGGAMVCYLLFNVFQYWKKAKFAAVLFMLPALGAFVPFFINKVDFIK